jgi:hypothetical protein
MNPLRRVFCFLAHGKDAEMKKEYEDAFNDDEAMPMVEEAVAEMPPMTDESPVDSPAAEMPEPAEAPAEIVEDMAEPETAEVIAEAPVDMSPEDIQREKSWEGRLKKREEELAARESSMGNLPKGEALAKLAEQFGPEFADLLVQVVKEVTPDGSDNLMALKEEVTSVIEDLKFSNHQGAIKAAHADAYEIGESEEFGAWCGQQEDADECKRIVERGTTSEVISVLSRYKKHLASSETSDAEDAAGAVRGSAPISLPNRPAAGADDEYSAAWNAN